MSAPAVAAPAPARVTCATCGRVVAIYVLGGTAVPHARWPRRIDGDGRSALCPDRTVYRT